MPEEKTTTLAFYREPLVFELEETKYERYSPPSIPKEIMKFVKKPLALIPKEMQRIDPPSLPKLAEFQLARHYLHLAQMNFTVDSGFYPLGSCTMKYNPK
ncbi:MAG: hypothetical protein KAS22_11730, partial [Candidatus Heimdallarchaeota archaeon]|nr:hypothetical protein [Candidatus Heimdallarchaeota archaeon]